MERLGKILEMQCQLLNFLKSIDQHVRLNCVIQGLLKEELKEVEKRLAIVEMDTEHPEQKEYQNFFKTATEKVTRQEVEEMAEMLAKIQQLPPLERVAVQYYLKGILDNSMAASTAS